MKREHFSSRLGFILITAACSIGLGNIWRFPYITGKYGGASFVIIYLIFLVILGLPVVVMEFAVGRASQRSTAQSFNILEPKGTKWHLFKYATIIGNYLLMMFYTTVAGWMLAYCWSMLKGDLSGLTPDSLFLFCNCSLVRYLRCRSAKGSGACHKNHDVASFLPSAHSGRQVRHASQCGNRAALLPVS